jgi:hypothetical protein
MPCIVFPAEPRSGEGRNGNSLNPLDIGKKMIELHLA